MALAGRRARSSRWKRTRTRAWNNGAVGSCSIHLHFCQRKICVWQRDKDEDTENVSVFHARCIPFEIGTTGHVRECDLTGNVRRAIRRQGGHQEAHSGSTQPVRTAIQSVPDHNLLNSKGTSQFDIPPWIIAFFCVCNALGAVYWIGITIHSSRSDSAIIRGALSRMLSQGDILHNAGSWLSTHTWRRARGSAW